MTSRFFLFPFGLLACFSAALRAAPALPCCQGGQAGQAAEPVAQTSSRSVYQLDSIWTNDAGRKVRLGALRGQPVVLSMFFASCEYACPVIVSDMKRLRDLLPPAARAHTRFVLVSFDTARDTPAVLEAYRKRMGLDGAWTLLRGNADVVQELAMVLGVKYKEDARGQFSHSNLITVLDDNGEIMHQRPGLAGDVSEAAKAVSLAAR